jgi:hypothetical protein
VKPGIAIGLLLGILAQAAAALGVVWIATHEQRIADQFAVWRYEPTAAIAEYADRAQLTDEGRFLFYASSPSVHRDPAFGNVCGRSTESFGVLGCYVPADRTITLFDVTDERLDGIEEVVAAHEMLHAVWDRMSRAEQDALIPLLDAEAEKRADDPAFQETLALYAELEPGERHNELHSIIGTEFPDTSSALETHYSRYLGDRTAVLALHDRSNAVFVEYQTKAETLAAALDELKASIDADYAAYTAGIDALNAAIDDFNRRAGIPGAFSSQSQFDAERNGLTAQGQALDAQYAAIRARGDEYDAKVAELNAIYEEIAVLNEAINIDVPELTTG